MYSLQDIVEEELRVLESNCPHHFKNEDHYSESELSNDEEIPQFEEFLWRIHISFTLLLEDLEEYSSEKRLNDLVYEDTSTLKNEEISRLARIIVNKKARQFFFMVFDDNKNLSCFNII